MEELHDIHENSVKVEDPRLVGAVDSVENGPALSPSNGLTSIHQRIHWPATHISGGSDTHELDRIAVDNFLDTLANVALAIAAREHSENNDKERDE